MIAAITYVIMLITLMTSEGIKQTVITDFYDMQDCMATKHQLQEREDRQLLAIGCAEIDVTKAFPEA